MTDEEPTSRADAEVAGNEATKAPGEAGDPEVALTDPDEVMKQKYREAMAHKHGASGAEKKTHGDAGTSGQSQSAGPTQKMFRRKAGG
ncbi:MAG TPA: DUF5302 family protein [Motilibacterales bacterium]|nr:DUF5302 family protein [Motilibacterales bacterium]